jgi:predicted N-acetyltransferase YhbS
LEGILLRPLTDSDLEAAEALTRGAQWPHRVEDWRFGLAHGDGVAAVRNTEVVGTAMRWLWGERHATLGMVIVSPPEQGLRIGQHLVQAVMQGLERHSILLHATAEGRTLYERAGFRPGGEVWQHQGVALPAQLVALPHGTRLRPMGRNDPQPLALLDAHAAGMPRDAMIRQLLQGEVVVLARNGEALGFSVLRRFGRGYAIGPVVAPDLDSAKALIGYWCSHCAGRLLRIDVDAASGLSDWLKSAGLARVGTVAAMVRGASPQRGPAHGGWALVNQSMG